MPHLPHVNHCGIRNVFAVGDWAGEGEEEGREGGRENELGGVREREGGRGRGMG